MKFDLASVIFGITIPQTPLNLKFKTIMKKLFFFTLLVLCTTFGSVAWADDSTICIKKAGETTATVSTFSSDKQIAVVPISFDSGADWDSVKDSYTVSSDVAAGLASKKITVSIGSDGTATFHSKK